MKKIANPLRCALTTSVSTQDIEGIEKGIATYLPKENVSSVLRSGLRFLLSVGFARLTEIGFFERDGYVKLAKQLDNNNQPQGSPTC